MPSVYSLRNLLHDLHEDLRFYGGKSAKSSIAVLLFDARFRLISSYRISRYLYLRNRRYTWLHRVLKYRQRTRGCNDVSPKAAIGARIVLPHPFGIVIGEDVCIEDGVTVYQYVTLGSHGRRGVARQYPLIRTKAKLFSGVVVAGGVTVGEGAVVGANSVVLSDIPDYACAVGAPARVLTHESG
jgi:serine O-acetyltransferase